MKSVLYAKFLIWLHFIQACDKISKLQTVSSRPSSPSRKDGKKTKLKEINEYEENECNNDYAGGNYRCIVCGAYHDSEALCILPFFTAAAVPGLYVGCLIANIMTGAGIWDILFGSLATLIGAVGTYLLRKHKFLMTLPPVIANMIIVPLVLRYGYGITWYYEGKDFAIPYFVTTVGIGEIVSICILGSILLKVLMPYKNVIFKNS